MRSSFIARAYRPGLVLVAAGLLAIINCHQVDVVAVDADVVMLDPPSASVAVSQTTRFTATVLGDGGVTLSGRTIDWSSLQTSIATVDNTGTVRGVTPGVATIRASVGGATGTAEVTVTASGGLVLAPSPVDFTAFQSGASPGDRTVTVTANGGTVTGLSVAVSYGAGQPTGWLSHTLASTSTPTTIVLSVNQTGLALGTYNATLQVSYAGSTTPATMPVTLNVLTSAPFIGLGATTRSFVAQQNGANPAPQTVGVTNAGAGNLTGLGATIQYTTGQPTGWLSATLSSGTAPATITLRATTGTLPSATYTANVRVTSAVAQNSPQTIVVTFTVGGTPGMIAVDPTSLSFTATTVDNPSSRGVQVTNVGGASLEGLAVSVAYTGGATGWLNALLSATSAPATVTVTALTGALPNGTYTGTLFVASSTAANSPVTVPVTFTVNRPPSQPTSLTASAVSSSQINLAWSASTGTLTEYRIERKTGAGGTYAQIATVAAGTLSYSDPGLTPATEYFYQVTACNAVGCSAFSTEASATTGQIAPGTPSTLSAAAAGGTQINLTWSASAGTVTEYRIERKTGAAGVYAQITTVAGNVLSYQDLGLATGTEYFYQVRACNTVGCSGYSPEASATTSPPSAPTGLSATTISASQINLSWTAPSGTIVRHEIQRKAGATGTYATIASVNAPALTYQDNGLTAGTQYFYQVLACNNAGCSSPSTEASATTPPPTPGTLTASAASQTQINLGWGSSAGVVTDYRVERSPTSGGTFIEIAAVAGTTHQDNTVSAGTTYYYRVRACNSGGCSNYTNEASATTPPNPPSTPATLSANAVSPSQIDLSWSASTGAANYQLERSTTSNTGFAPITTTAGTSHSDTGRDPQTTYYYRVSACNAGGCSAPTAEASATTPPLPPNTPGTLTANASSPSQIDLSWGVSTGTVDNYRVERSIGSNSSFTEIATVTTGTTYPSTGLDPSTTYFYRVRACNAGGCSGYTNEASATTHPLPAPGQPTGVSATATSESQINLAWTAASGTVHFYRIQRSLVTGSGYTNVDSLSNSAISYNNTGLAAGTQYFYLVLACNTSACTPSTEVSATTWPSAPNLTATAGTPGSLQIDLVWTAGSGATEYRIERRLGSGTFSPHVSGLPSTTLAYSDTGLTAGQPYGYRVSACNASGCTMSNVANATAQ